MNLDRKAGLSLSRKSKLEVRGRAECEVHIIVPFVHLANVAESVSGSPIVLGAQNFYPESKGAFTGEISIDMIREAGATEVLIGHSERRHVLNESIDFITKKTDYAQEQKMNIIFCVGEKIEEREAGKTMDVIAEQILAPLRAVTDLSPSTFIVAYEPVWAIGTGKTASPADAQEVHENLRSIIKEEKGASFAEEVRILYGGSVKKSNVADLLAQKDIDGCLVGGASIEEDSWKVLIDAGFKLGER